VDRLPLFFDLNGRDVLLVGDGPAADAKRRLIESAGGRVVAESETAHLAFVAFDGDAAAAEAARLKAAGLLVNVVDRPDLCDFIVPAIVDRSPVVVAIGTNGASATLAKVLRERLEALLPASLGALARSIAARRGEVAARLPQPDQRRRFWDRLLAPGGALDPFGEAPPAEAAIAAALTEPGAPAASLTLIALVSADPDDLSLRQLRLLSQADTIFHAPSVPAAVLDRARRDAARVTCEAPPAELPAGNSLFVIRS
jgi:uroporphyrin-III C-methyltransferase / precorrin-2 dehydrogenase / sirohydrochlorin ferrochelatase